MATNLDQLQWALQALAAPAPQQIKLFPPFVCVPDELVLDLDQWMQAASVEAEFTSVQKTALDHLTARIDTWSGSAHPDVWTDCALEKHPAWIEFRTLAEAALAAFDWPAEIPPFSRGAVYVGGGTELKCHD